MRRALLGGFGPDSLRATMSAQVRLKRLEELLLQQKEAGCLSVEALLDLLLCFTAECSQSPLKREKHVNDFLDWGKKLVLVLFLVLLLRLVLTTPLHHAPSCSAPQNLSGTPTTGFQRGSEHLTGLPGAAEGPLR